MIIKLNYDKDEVRALARGRWKYIFTQLTNLALEFLDGRHHPCPNCGGKDRARVLDIETGALFCNQCFYENNGDGFAALVWLLGCSFSEAVNLVGSLLNGQPDQPQPVKRIQAAPKKPATPLNEQIQFLDHDPSKFEELASHKPPATPKAIQDAGGRLAIWPAKAPTQCQQECIAFPAYRNSDDPSGWILYRVDGQPFPAMKDGPGERKTHLLRGSDDGWVFLGGRSAVEAAHTIIKVEGLPDALSIYSLLPAGYAVVTNTHGAKSAAKKCPIDIFTGKRVIVIGDNDESGVDGAHSLAREILPYASEVKMIFPDGEVTESNGRDLRDVMNENQQAGIDHQKTVAALIKKAEQAEPFQIAQDEPQQDDSETDDSSDDDDQEEYQPFPVHCLPEVLRRYVVSGGESLKCDFSFIALPLLVVAASLIGAARVLQPTKDWRVPGTLWGVVIANSGSMKSPALSMATWPLYKLQAKAHIRNAEVIEAYEKRKSIYEIRYKEYLKEVARGEGQPPDEPEKPDEPRIIDKIASDVTPERLAHMNNNNRKGSTLITDELVKLLNLDKYNGAKGSNNAVLMEGYNLGTIQVARRHDPNDLFVPNSSICIGGTIQPEIYKRTMCDSHRESGFTARFLEVYPPRSAKQYPGEGISDEIKEALMNVVELLDQLQPMESEPGIFNPIPIYLTGEAKAEYKKFHRWHNTEALTMNGDLSSKWSKLEEIPLRLSLIFHYVENITASQIPDRVSAETMLNAIELTEWFKREAKRVNRLFGSEGGIVETPQQQQQKRLIRLIRRKGGRVKPRDIQQGIKDIPTATQAESELNELVKDGVGEWVNSETGNPGMPSRVFQLFTRSTGQHSTSHAKNSRENMGVVDRSTENDDSQPVPAPEPIGEQFEQAAPDDLGDFMDYMDGK